MLKKIFYGSLYLVLQIMIFTYMVIDPRVGEERIGDLVTNTQFTGIPVICIIMIFPAFVFTIIALSMNKKAVTFCRDLFSMFVGLFALASSVIGVFKMYQALYVPIIIALCSLFLLIISIINVAGAMKEESKEPEKASE